MMGCLLLTQKCGAGVGALRGSWATGISWPGLTLFLLLIRKAGGIKGRQSVCWYVCVQTSASVHQDLVG